MKHPEPPLEPGEIHPSWKPVQLMVHDDDCNEFLTNDGECPKCKFHPDMESVVFVVVSPLKYQELRKTGRTFLGVGRARL